MYNLYSSHILALLRVIMANLIRIYTHSIASLVQFIKPIALPKLYSIRILISNVKMLFIVYLFSSLLFYLLVNAFSSSVPGLEKRNRGEFDFFGPTDYGFKCETKVYPKNEIYAATQKACFSRFSNQHKIIFGEYAYQTPESVPRDTDFLEFIKASGKIAKPMFYPILRDKVLFEESELFQFACY